MQEIVILIFLTILTLFQTIRSEAFLKSRIRSVMDWFIIIGVLLAILAEFFTILYTIYEAVRELLRKKTNPEAQEKAGKIEMISNNDAATDSVTNLKKDSD